MTATEVMYVAVRSEVIEAAEGIAGCSEIEFISLCSKCGDLNCIYDIFLC